MESIEIKKKQNFFKKAYNAITNFESYKEFYLEVGFKPIAYLIKLSLIVSFIFSLFFVYQLSDGIKKILLNELPNFEYEDGILNFADTVNIERDNNLFIVDTSMESTQGLEKYKETMNLYDNITIFFKDKAIYKAEGIESMPIPYSEIYQRSFSRDDILSLFDGKQGLQTFFILCLVIFPIMFIGYLIKALIYILILSVFGVFSIRILRMNLNYGSIFNLCVYGYTLSFILEIVFYIIELFTGFHVYRFDMISLLIAYVYLITALRIIKNDFIKRQEEYAKLNMETSVGTDSLNDEK